MTDSEMNAIEKRLSARPIESPWNEKMYYEAILLELIREFRQIRAERDWLASAIGLGMVSNCEDKTFDEILQMARDAMHQSGDTK